MRAHVEIRCIARTMEEIRETLTTKWCELVEDDTASLPSEAEITIKQTDNNPDALFYVATLIARTKI